MSAVGKKKRSKVVYVRNGRGKSLTPILLLVGAAAAYLWISHNSTSSGTVTDITPTPSGEDGLFHTNNPNIVDDGSGTGTDVIQPHPVTVAPGENMSAVSTTAATDRIVMLRDAAAYPGIVSALSQMTSAEILDAYNYFYSYYLPGKTLYRYPDPAHPGDWNTTLYDNIQVIRSKYKIF